MDKANLDWSNLPFSYIKTDYNMRFYYKNGQWSEGDLVQDENISINMASPCLHYGQEAFEGLKAFETRDGRIVCFRPEENAKRLNRSITRIQMPSIPENLFLKGIEKVIAANKKFVPPYGTGASLYIRPLIIGTGPKVGLGPAEEYMMVVFVTPVGPYYKGGFMPVKALVLEEYDRAAPSGVGDIKVGGNYAAGLPGSSYAKSQGFPIALYLDPKEKKFIDEFSTSNFIGIKGDKYVTPSSKSILPSITNATLATLAEDMGMKIERRPVEINEIKDFDEIGAVGTAAVITPVNEIKYQNKYYNFLNKDSAGPVLTKLYDVYTNIQTGVVEDKFNWLFEVK